MTKYFSIFLLFLLPVQLFGQTNDCMQVRDVSENEKAFKSGERLVYVINYQWGLVNTDVGEAEARVTKIERSEFGTHYHSVIRGHTYKFYDIFFKVRDLFESKFDVSNGRPFYFHRDIAEGRYRIKNTFFFNQDNSIDARVERGDNNIKDTLLQGNECTFDLVSLFYFARNMDFSGVSDGDPQPIVFVIDDEVFNMYYRYIGKESIKVPGMGKFRTMKFAAKVVAGEVFSGEEEIVLWVSDDNNKVPLLFETPIKVGKVKGRLSIAENLKFPLTSKIN
ncbi:MAG: DUF3108 domain-containing protein [Bacteroidales bacterium]